MPREKQFDEADVLERFTEVFWQKGYNACSVGDLVAASGLSRSSLYDTFGDKEQLFVRCLQHYTIQVRESLEEATAAKSSAIEKIETALRLPFAAKKKSNAGCLLVNTMVELNSCSADIHQVLLHAKAGYEDFLADCVKQGQRNGEITNKASSEKLAGFLYTVFCGLLVAYKAKPQKTLMDQQIALAMSLLQHS